MILGLEFDIHILTCSRRCIGPCGPTSCYSFHRCRSLSVDTRNIRLADVGHFSGHFIESEKRTWFLLIQKNNFFINIKFGSVSNVLTHTFGNTVLLLARYYSRAWFVTFYFGNFGRRKNPKSTPIASEIYYYGRPSCKFSKLSIKMWKSQKNLTSQFLSINIAIANYPTNDCQWRADSKICVLARRKICKVLHIL